MSRGSPEYYDKLKVFEPDELYCPSKIFKEETILMMKKDAWMAGLGVSGFFAVIFFFMRVDLPIIVMLVPALSVPLAFFLHRVASENDPLTTRKKSRGWLRHALYAKFDRPKVYSPVRTKLNHDTHKAETVPYKPYIYEKK